MPAQAGEGISLQLKLRHAFQFAGFYMAQEKGFYSARGLHVKLLEGGPEHNPIRYVLGGEGRYGISDTGIVLARSRGASVKLLASIFQHSPLALAVLRDSDIHTFSDLHDKRVMMQGEHMDAVILAAMKKSGIKAGDFIRQDTSFDLHDLIEGRTDAFSVYLTDQPQQFKSLGIPYRLLRPADYGIDFYGDTLITSNDELLHHPKRAQAFIQASMQGWDYALNHIDESVDLILREYNSQHLSREQLLFEAYKTSEMVLKDVVSLGYMSQARWQKTIQTYAELGLIDRPFQASGMLYTPAPDIMDFLALYRWRILIFVLFILALLFAVQSRLLRRMVRVRTRDLQSSETRFRTLVANIPGAVYRCRPDIECTMEFISDDIEGISGYPPAEFIGNATRSYRSIIHPDDQLAVHGAMDAATGGRAPYALEYRILCADGSKRWVMETGQSESIGAEHSLRNTGCIFDITRRKHAEQLKASITSILEMIAGEQSLARILEAIVLAYEKHYPGLRASILLLKDGRLYMGAAPNLPASYN
ncbi:MAG: ABC transporter substrate-binding protein, partial [Mariprofundaceae bacterium]|nr:ABC transporter substrate-binding protein [Mariprofundaceae bacterium]